MNIISDTNIGGAGKDVITYCNNYNKKKIELTVVIPKGSLLKEEIQKANVNIIELDGLKDKSLDIQAIPKLIKLIKKEKPDIVHTHASLSARIASRFCKNVKIVYTKHCVFPPGKKYNYSIVRKANRLVTNLLADKIIASAQVAKDDLIKQGNQEEKIIVILNGVDGFKKLSDATKNQIRQKYNIGENDIVVGILARIEELKGHKYFVEAADILKKSGYTNIKYLIMGTGSYEEELKEKVSSLGLKEDIIFTGFIKNVEEILNIVDIQVNASYISETTCLSLLEGMSLGIPAVATNCGGTSKVIRTGENGILVEKENANEIAEGIKWLLEDKQKLDEIQHNCIEIFNDEYNAKKYAENFEKVYESMVKDNENNRK